ncbi:MAG: acyltransferase, partial [Pirellula sp.]
VRDIASAPAAEYYAHPSAIVDEGATIGKGSKIWHFSHISSGSTLGEDCNLGQNVFVASGVTMGRNVKVQNNVSIYAGTEVHDDVFLGPSCVLTNVTNPRSQVVRRNIYEKTVLRRGATIGANATIVCGVDLGRYSFVAAGAVVTEDVPDYGMVKGVPARLSGWMSRHGHLLSFDAGGHAICAESGLEYRLEVRDGIARVYCVSLAEDAPLPEELRIGNRSYDTVRANQRSGDRPSEPSV